MSPKATNTNELKPEDFATPYEYMTAKTLQEINERVPLQLPKDNENYKDPVPVCVNGTITVIERGVPLMVKRGTVDILMQSQHQLYSADARAVAASSQNMGDR